MVTVTRGSEWRPYVSTITCELPASATPRVTLPSPFAAAASSSSSFALSPCSSIPISLDVLLINFIYLVSIDFFRVLASVCTSAPATEIANLDSQI
jgi:hypothetical protein